MHLQKKLQKNHLCIFKKIHLDEHEAAEGLGVMLGVAGNQILQQGAAIVFQIPTGFSYKDVSKSL
jgi:hypothetical protein